MTSDKKVTTLKEVPNSKVGLKMPSPENLPVWHDWCVRYLIHDPSTDYAWITFSPDVLSREDIKVAVLNRIEELEKEWISITPQTNARNWKIKRANLTGRVQELKKFTGLSE